MSGNKVPEDSPPLVLRLVGVEYSLSLAQTLYFQCAREGRDMQIEVIGWLWEKAHSLKEELEKLAKLLPPEPDPE